LRFVVESMNRFVCMHILLTTIYTFNEGGFYVVDRGLVDRNDNDGGFYVEDQLQPCQLTALYV